MRIQKEVYDAMGWDIGDVQHEKEGQEYAACSFTINGKIINFRSAKVTPIKIGQFVTMWKRDSNGITAPFDVSDAFDFFVISVRENNSFGQFVFSKDVLCRQGFVSKDGKGGKRAMRVYPAWDKAINAQAKKTQAWQLKYFFEFKPNIDKAMIRKFFE
jgi:hypothetical protein